MPEHRDDRLRLYRCPAYLLGLKRHRPSQGPWPRGPALCRCGRLNRVYRQCQPDLLLLEQQGEALRQIAIRQLGFSDVVVWNPGETMCATLPDMAPQGYRNMLCIEAAQLSQPVHLEPGQRWIGSQSLHLL
ncbi:MAG: hypothetical protein EBT05_00130 [Betaproteobacteria bacterium]|nr:hypothetical protein [Betaproteobacteria bacterium]